VTALAHRSELPGRRTQAEALSTLDALSLVLLCGLAVVARRPGYLFSHSLWLDEGWVADSVRAPLRQLRLMTSSTPIGWTLLLRLVPHIGPPERLRALPLAFGVAAVVAGWSVGRGLGRPQALAAGLAAALAPSALANHNLKQYSADAAVTLLLLALAAWVEAGWSPRRLAVLCLVCVPALLVSHVTMFASAAALLALAVVALLRRDRGQLAWTLALGAGTALVEGVIYLVFAAPGNNADMQRIWEPLFVPLSDGPGRAAGFVVTRLASALDRVGFGPPLLAAAVVCAGVAVLWRARQRAAAMAVPLLTAVLVLASAARRYPLLDDRTSLFFTTVLTVVGALAVGQTVAWAARRRATLPVGLAAVVAAGALLVPAARAAAAEQAPVSSMRAQVAYVLAHRQPGDVVVVGWAASFAFAYYWPDQPAFSPTQNGSAVLFRVGYPGRRDLVLTPQWRVQSLADHALRAAAARSSSHRAWLVLAEAGDGGPVWNLAVAHARPGGARVVRRELPRLVVFDAASGSPQ